MKKTKKKGLHATEVKVYPRLKSNSPIKAIVKVVLNDALVLNGLRIIKGQFGHFISFPEQQPGSPFKVYDILSFNMRRRLQDEILQAYAKALTKALPAG